MPSVPEVREFVNGLTDASEINTGLGDPLSFLRDRIHCKVYQTGAQTFTTGVAAALGFDSEDWDVGDGHDTAVNISRYTAPYTGIYAVGGGISFATNATGARGCAWNVNGASINGGWSMVGNAGGSVPTRVAAISTELLLNLGDYLELMGFQNSGGNLATVVTTLDRPTMVVRWVASA